MRRLPSSSMIRKVTICPERHGPHVIPSTYKGVVPSRIDQLLESCLDQLLRLLLAFLLSLLA